jgi:hypothetical protein
MTALKTYLPTLAADLGRNTEQLNEWLRALVAGKALSPREGRGPGSGVELTPTSVATFLLALLSSDIRNEAVGLAKAISKAKPKSPPCPITGMSNLRDAIAVGLEGRGFLDGKPASLHQILLFRGKGVVVLYWRLADGEPFPISFSTKATIDHDQLAVNAVLHDKAIEKIIIDLRAPP